MTNLVQNPQPNKFDNIEYTIEQLKSLIRFMGIADDSNNPEDICIITDLKTILGLYPNKEDLRIVTPKQKQALVEYLVKDRPQADVAEDMHISQQGVSVLIKSGLTRIQKHLKNEDIVKVHWTEEEKDILMQYYPLYGPTVTADKLNKPKVKVISMYHYLSNKQKDVE